MGWQKVAELIVFLWDLPQEDYVSSSCVTVYIDFRELLPGLPPYATPCVRIRNGLVEGIVTLLPSGHRRR
jgi:hypothetical protein